MSDALDFDPGHRSPFNLIFDTKRPGIHRRVVFMNPDSCGEFLDLMSACRLTICYFTPFELTNPVEMTGFEPVTFALQRRCSPAELHPQDLLGLVGLTGFEPVTPALSAQCSNQLSYKPAVSLL